MSEKTILGACPHDCPDTCSMLFKVKGGKVEGVRGNPDHPFTRGRLCIKVNDYENRVNSDRRILYPLKRVGPKGSGQFQRVSWGDALSEIKTRWDGIISEHGAQSIMPYGYLGVMGIINGLNVGDPFFNRLGATISERSFCDSGSITAYAMTIGDSAAVDPESVVHSKFIVLWACNTLGTNSHHWPFIMEARKRGAQLVVIDPFKTKTARQADWHIPIRPGTDGALALGLMKVIVDEGLTDDEYIKNYTLGFGELKTRLDDYPAEKVSEITGIPVDDIHTLAKEFAKSHASVIRIGVAIERHHGGGQTVRAISCLPGITGAWRHPGGGMLQLPIWAFPVNWEHLMRPDLLSEEPRVVNCWRLGEALTGEMELNPPIKSLMVYNGNPVIMAPDQDRMIAGLKREDLFTIVSEQFLTDTALYADIILPATTQAEQEDIMFSWGHLYLTYNNKAIKPIGEAVSNSELFRRLAATMGFDDDPYFTRSDKQMIAESMIWDDPKLEGITVESVKKSGYTRLNVPDSEHYAPHAEGNFHTPSTKCEFKASVAAGGNFVVPLFRQGYDGQQLGDPIDPLPHYIPPRESPETNVELAKKFPLNLISPKSHAFISSSYGNMERQSKYSGNQSIWMNTQDALSRSIASGQKVRIQNDRGVFEASAQITNDVMEGVVVAPVGYWREKDRTGNTVQSVLSSNFADLGAAPTFSDNLVEVEAV